jgi:hypothetical protein
MGEEGILKSYEGQTVESWLGSRLRALFGPPSKGGTAKNLHPKSEILTLSCRMIWVWSETVNFYNR